MRDLEDDSSGDFIVRAVFFQGNQTDQTDRTDLSNDVEVNLCSLGRPDLLQGRDRGWMVERVGFIAVVKLLALQAEGDFAVVGADACDALAVMLCGDGKMGERMGVIWRAGAWHYWGSGDSWAMCCSTWARVPTKGPGVSILRETRVAAKRRASAGLWQHRDTAFLLI